MDIKQRLALWSKVYTGSLDATLGRSAILADDALAEIERLERYTQHQPACALVLFRIQSHDWTFVPPAPSCSCGLIATPPVASAVTSDMLCTPHGASVGCHCGELQIEAHLHSIAKTDDRGTRIHSRERCYWFVFDPLGRC